LIAASEIGVASGDPRLRQNAKTGIYQVQFTTVSRGDFKQIAATLIPC
jgi:hypothetical protein